MIWATCIIFLAPPGKRPREGEPESMTELWQRVHSTAQGCLVASRAREGVRSTAASLEACGPPSRPRGGIRIMEGRET